MHVLRGMLRTLDQRLPIVVKVGVPVLAVSVGMAYYLQSAVVDEIRSQCASPATPRALCTDASVASDVAGRVALVSTDSTALLLVALWLVFYLFVMRRTRRLADAAARVAGGDLTVRVSEEQPDRHAGAGAGDELVRVGAEFDRMLAALEAKQERLAAAEASHRAVVETANDAFVGIDAAGRITEWNARAVETFGWSKEEALGRVMSELIVPAQFRERHDAGLRHAVAGGPAPLLGKPVELSAVRRDGREFPIELTVWASPDADGQRYNAFIRDIEARKALEEQLSHQAFHDPLTGLANRALFLDRTGHALDRRTDSRQAAVLFLDLDDFKTINDSLGHTAGDELIVAVAERLRRCMREGDTLARLAGDEFAILVEGVADVGEATALADRVVGMLEPPFLVAGTEVFAHASIGIAMGSPEAGSRPDDLVRDADVAMYTAKRRGKSTFEIFEPAMHASVVQRMERKAHLERALERDELVVHYQPYISLGSSRIAGFEALVRWNHPDHGVISPADFIPLAEETGLIRQIGLWVLEQACQRARSWHLAHPDVPPVSMSVNVSVHQLYEPSLAQDVAQVLAATGLDPATLVLEITESAMMADADVAAARLAELKALGVRLAVDDFGTGYSSLSYLQRFPVDIFKIDRSFIDGLGETPERGAMVRAVLELGRTLGLQSVAEGVESAEQLAALESLGCEVVQGFYFSRPVDEDAAATLLGPVPEPRSAETDVAARRSRTPR